MKVLLVSPHVPLDVVYGKGTRDTGAVMPPLGIFYLASYLQTRGRHEIELLDANALQLDTPALLRHLAGKQFDCVGFTATTLGYPYAVDGARAIRAAQPNLRLLIGGAHAQGDPEGILADNPGLFDFVCYGEGELAFELLLDHLEGRIREAALQGWMYRKDGAVVVTPPAPVPDNLDMFGHPSRLLPRPWVSLYHEKVLSYKRLPLFAIMASRGCPFSCTFCSTPRKFKSLYQGRMRYHSIDWIVEEMKYLEEELQINEILFCDDTFNLSRDRVLAFCRAKTERGVRMAWSCNFEANIADRKMLEIMRDAGCWSIMVGGESGCDRVLQFIRKGVTTDQLRLVGTWANEVGLVSRVSFILGLPTDTRETIEETLAFIRRCDFHFPYFQLYVPLPGTEMYDHLAEHGRMLVTDPRERSASRVNYLPHGLTPDDLRTAYRRAFRRSYLRWRMIRNHLQFIRTAGDVARYWRGFKALLSL